MRRLASLITSQYEAGDLPFTIQQVTQNLENGLFTFNKIWVSDVEESERAEKEVEKEEGGNGKKKKKERKKKKSKEEKEDEDKLNSELIGAIKAKDLAPYASSIANTSLMSPLSRAKVR